MANNKMNIFKTMDNLKAGAKKASNTVYEITDHLVDSGLKNGSKWQKIMAKAMNAGTGILAKQQDLVLTTLEELKDQYAYGNKRFRKLVDFGFPKPKEVVKTVKSKSEKTIKAAKKVTAKVAKKVEAEVASAKSDVKKDDLKAINGIGPKIESFLNVAGIYTFAKLATTDTAELQKILDTAGPRFRAQDPSDWTEQAKAMIKK